MCERNRRRSINILTDKERQEILAHAMRKVEIIGEIKPPPIELIEQLVEILGRDYYKEIEEETEEILRRDSYKEGGEASESFF